MSVEEERVKKLIDYVKEYASRGWTGAFSMLCRKSVEIFEPLYKEYENQKIENAELKAENERLKQTCEKVKKEAIKSLDEASHKYLYYLSEERSEARKETAEKILEMLDDRNYITEQDLKNAIAKQFGVEIKE